MNSFEQQKTLNTTHEVFEYIEENLFDNNTDNSTESS